MTTAAVFTAARNLDEIGIRRNLLEDLSLKILYMEGELSLRELAFEMCVNLAIVEEIFQRLRKDQLVEVTGMTIGVHRIAATSAGKSRALELLAQNQYAGPAPVSLKDYVDRVHAQSVRE